MTPRLQTFSDSVFLLRYSSHSFIMPSSWAQSGSVTFFYPLGPFMVQAPTILKSCQGLKWAFSCTTAPSSKIFSSTPRFCLLLNHRAGPCPIMQELMCYFLWKGASLSLFIWVKCLPCGLVAPRTTLLPVFILLWLHLPSSSEASGDRTLPSSWWVGWRLSIFGSTNKWILGWNGGNQGLAGQNSTPNVKLLASKVPDGDPRQLSGTTAGSAICTHHNIFYWGFQQILSNGSICVPLLTHALATENLSWQFHISKCCENVPRLKLSAVCQDVMFYSGMHFFPPSRLFSTW